MLIDDIKTQMVQALKARNTVAKNVLSVALGEIQVAAARPGAKGSDEDSVAVVRKLVKSNEETLVATTDEAEKAKLVEELVVLRALLPQTLGVPQIVEALAPLREQLRAAANDGQATGVAVKHLKAQGASVTGKDVTEAVKQLRA